MGRCMAGLAWLGVISYALGACGGESTDGSVAGGGAAGTGAVGGGGTGGIGGSGGTGGSGGSSTGGVGGATGGTGGGTSAGSVKLVFEVPASKSYCVSTDNCSQTSSIAIKDGSGKVLARWAGLCYLDCVVCEQLPCPGIACMPDAKAVTGETLDWDGGYWDASTCGAAKACTAHYFAKPGKYTATMCATPGTITTDDAYGSKQCTVTGPAECVDVPFDFPSNETFTGKLPG